MFEQPANEAPTIHDYVDAIQRRKWLVVVAALAGLLLSMIFVSARTASYEATARVALGPSRALSLDDARSVAPNLEREREIVLSDEVIEDAAERVEVSPTQEAELIRNSAVAFRPDSDVLTIDVVADDAALSAAFANAIASTYVDLREGDEIAFFDIRTGNLETFIEETQAEVDEIRREVIDLDQQRTNTLATVPGDDPGRASTIAAIDADRNVLRTRESQLNSVIRDAEKDLRELEDDEAARVPAAELIGPATVPSAPQGLPAAALNLAGLLVGAAAGVVGAFVLARLDRRARNASDIERVLGAGLLSSVPRFGFSNERGPRALVMAVEDPNARLVRAVESIRRLRTAIGFLAQTEDSRSFMFSSAYPGEGKSTIVANLGIAFAQSGKRTVVVSADLRRPTLEALFERSASTGLSQWLGGDDVELLIDLDVPDLYLIPAGPTAFNSSELLGSERFGALIEELERKFDVVLIDSPPVLSTADTGTAAARVDGVIVVIDGRSTELDQLAQVRADLERSGAEVRGAVLNRERVRRTLPWRRRDRYAYNYKSG